MFDWFSLIFGTLWISGLSGLLAAVSYQRWQASLQQRPLRELWQSAANQKFTTSCTLLFMIGIASSSRQLWETAIWLILIAVYTLYTISIWRQVQG